MHRKETKLDRVWYNMRRRCYSPSCPDYKNYGGRGIKICSEWSSRTVFEKWALSHGYAEGLQIDRIDNDGDYSPDNCRFVTPKKNCQNRRPPINGIKANAAKPIYYDGEMTTIAELSRRWKIPYATLRNRLLTKRDLRTGR